MMRIAFDLDDTLMPIFFEFPVIHHICSGFLKTEGIRAGTRELFGILRRNGYEIWIYTTSYRKKLYIKSLFLLHGLRIDGIINQTIHLKHVKVDSSKYPPAFDIDILIDDCKEVEIEGKRFGFKTIIIQPDDHDWISKVISGIRLCYL